MDAAQWTLAALAVLTFLLWGRANWWKKQAEAHKKAYATLHQQTKALEEALSEVREGRALSLAAWLEEVHEREMREARAEERDRVIQVVRDTFNGPMASRVQERVNAMVTAGSARPTVHTARGGRVSLQIGDRIMEAPSAELVGQPGQNQPQSYFELSGETPYFELSGETREEPTEDKPEDRRAFVGDRGKRRIDLG
jgi:hypothetical protein